MDSIPTLVDLTKQDLDSLLVNECTSTDNSSQRHNYALPDIAPVDLETRNCSPVETSTDIDS